MVTRVLLQRMAIAVLRVKTTLLRAVAFPWYFYDEYGGRGAARPNHRLRRAMLPRGMIPKREWSQEHSLPIDVEQETHREKSEIQ